MSSMVLDGLSPRSRMVSDATLPQQVFARIRREGECWVWTGLKDTHGYGRLTVTKTRSSRAHRWLYEYFVGEIPSGLTIDHLCRNRACVAPYHLEAVTQSENSRRANEARAVGAHKAICSHGHHMAPDNLYVRKNRKGQDVHECRQCIRDQNTRKYRRRRGGVVGPANADKAQCKNGHLFDEENTYITKMGARSCRACGAASARRGRVRRMEGSL